MAVAAEGIPAHGVDDHKDDVVRRTGQDPPCSEGPCPKYQNHQNYTPRGKTARRASVPPASLLPRATAVSERSAFLSAGHEFTSRLWPPQRSTGITQFVPSGGPRISLGVSPTVVPQQPTAGIPYLQIVAFLHCPEGCWTASEFLSSIVDDRPRTRNATSHRPYFRNHSTEANQTTADHSSQKVQVQK